jgi:hypothetical protein
MHGTGVLSVCGGRSDFSWLECHSALRTAAGTSFVDVRMHRTDEFCHLAIMLLGVIWLCIVLVAGQKLQCLTSWFLAFFRALQKPALPVDQSRHLTSVRPSGVKHSLKATVYSPKTSTAPLYKVKWQSEENTLAFLKGTPLRVVNSEVLEHVLAS